MHGRRTQHEIGRRLADFSAAEHQPEVIGPDVLAAHFQAVAHRHRQTDAVAVFACLDARLHRRIDCGWVLHETSFASSRLGPGGEPAHFTARL
jgi:hypothetical protein